jgi:copper chaperone CopZ
MVKHTFRVINMECPNCAMRLERLEDRLAGVRQINASYRKMEMIVEFDEYLLTDQQIVKAAEEEGFEAVPVL